MKKVALTLFIGYLFTLGLASARPESGMGGGGLGGGGRDGGGNGGNGGGWSGGSNPNNNSGDTHDHSVGRGNWDGTTSSRPSYRNGGGWSHNNSIHSYNRSGGYNNYHSNNGWNRSYQGLHHFNRSNNYSSMGTNRTYGGFNRNPGHSSAIPQNLRNMGITHVPQPLTARASLPNGFQRQAPGLPAHGPGGQPFASSSISPSHMNSASVRTQMSAIAGNRTFMARIAATTVTPGMRNHYFWHQYNGFNYVSYFAPYGGCWYGWNFGAGFFWTQYYANNWWWYDPWWGRWCWWDGGWWWQDPATTTVYIYNNGSYAPADSNSGTANNPMASKSDDYGGPVYGDDGQQSSNRESVEADQSGEGKDATVDFLSQDGSIKVTVSEQGDAFLYKMNGSKSSGKPIFLESNVQEVKFSNSGTQNEKILLILKDGSFTTYNSDGTSADGTKA